jgi:hypothetical protein
LQSGFDPSSRHSLERREPHTHGQGQKPDPKVKRIDLDRRQSRAFLDRVQNRALVEEDYGIILAMARTIRYFTEALEEKTTSIKRRLKYLFGASTDTAKKLLHKSGSATDQAEAAESASSPKEKPRPKGHGRNGAASYTGAERVVVKHPELQWGDPCPACEKGKVYELALSSAVVRVTGSAPLRATVYELSRLRCNLCGIVSIYNGHKMVLFRSGRRHAGENLEDFLQQREQGIPPPLQMCDGAGRNLPKSFETILLNCLTHARRQFVDVVEAFPEPCAHVIELLSKVYHHDDQAREQGLTPRERLAFHQERSGPVMTELKTWCEEQLARKLVEPNSGLGKAIKYLLKRWEELTRFLIIEGAPLDKKTR